MEAQGMYQPLPRSSDLVIPAGAVRRASVEQAFQCARGMSAAYFPVVIPDITQTHPDRLVRVGC